MTASIQNLLDAFDALPPTEQQQAAAEILRRASGEGEIPDTALVELADELFQSYGDEEAGHAR